MPNYIIAPKDLQEDLVSFFENEEKGKKYIDVMEANNSRIITLNLDDIYDYSTLMFEGLVNCDLILDIIEEATTQVIVNRGGNRDPPIQAIIVGTRIPTMFIHQINSKHIGKVIRIHGMVSRASPHIRPVYSEAVFICSNCGQVSVPIEQFNPFFLFKPLGKCPSCKTSPMWIPDDSLSAFLDSQEFTTQESQNDIPSNRIPSQLKCITYKRHFMNYVNCGDDIDVIGVIRLLRRDKTSFSTPYIEVLSIEKRRKELSEIILDKADVEKILELSKMPNIYDLLVQSFAPSIYGNIFEKEAILHSIFGAPEKQKRDITIRGTIHILMVGDPATAKSQLLRAAIKLAPKGMYAMGRGTSAAGLTAALHKNEDSGEWEISAGVLVLSDEGISCIDEIDKMREEDRVNIHEAMEQGTVSINKAGIHATLRAKTAIISAANPPLGKFDRNKSVFDNLGDFPPSLFSRFDLIFTLFDTPDEETDKKVVTHIMDDTEEEGLISTEQFKKYIIYAKKINPVLSTEAKEYLKDYFVRVRNASAYSNQKDVPFTYRQFEALERLTLAHARMLLKSEANMEDVNGVKRLFDKFLDDIGHDVTGQNIGKSESKRTGMKRVLEIMEVSLKTNQRIHISELIKKSREAGIEDKIFWEALREMNNGKMITDPQANDGYIQYIGQRRLY